MTQPVIHRSAPKKGAERRTLCLRHQQVDGGGNNITTDDRLVTCKSCLKLMTARKAGAEVVS